MSEQIRTVSITEPVYEGGKIDPTAVLEDVLSGFVRHFALFLLLASLAASVCYLHVKRNFTPLYQAYETYIVTPSYSVNYNSSNYNRAARQQIILAFPYVISNDAMQRLIAKDLNTGGVPGTIRASSVEDTNAFTITVTAAGPKTAYNILQSVVKNYPIIAKDIIGDTNLSLMNSSGVPTAPINAQSPKRSALIGIGVVTALFAAVFIFFSMVKKTIRTEDDFRQHLNVKCLGSIPKVRLRGRKGSKAIRIDSKRVPYGFKESIRMLRTRVERRHSEDGSQVFLVSSAIAGEGKSTIAANLALSMAAKGAKTLLVDMDLRNSSVMQTLGLPSVETGITDLIEGKCVIKDILVQDEQSGLLILPAGHTVDAVQKLFEAAQTGTMFEVCRTLADYIIVDTPPSSILADASNLAEYADQGIFVVRQDYAPLNKVEEGLDLLYDTGLKLTGCVLNYTAAGAISRLSYGYGRYGYGYGRYGRYGSYGYSGKNGYYGTGKAVDEEE